MRLAPNGCVILNDEHGNELFSYNSEAVLIPASIIKILTSLVTLEILGKEYRFKTEFFLDKHQNFGIKGWGDPFLISEEISLITDTLLLKNLRQINRVYLDNSSFSSDLEIPGTSNSSNPYDALNGALVVNFNTIDAGKDKHGKIFSGEAVTPLTPLAIQKTRFLKPGDQQRINLTDRPEESLQYVGELFSVFLKNSGISIQNNTISQTIVDDSWTLLYTHYSTKSLESAVTGMLEYSNNFIANQIFLIVGAEEKGFPATLDKSRLVFKEHLRRKWSFEEKKVQLDEASGISKRNRITGKTMMTILEKFRVHSNLLKLKRGIRLKSGTLTGVYNYAGYFMTEKGLRPFVIMTQQKKNNRDKILSLLKNIDSIKKE
ncbi:D-alanyl-D-alanine carboxypeptidase [bacterium]|nr:D-alanyl-D-alanine carboxypeptidase [bacterium]